MLTVSLKHQETVSKGSCTKNRFHHKAISAVKLLFLYIFNRSLADGHIYWKSVRQFLRHLINFTNVNVMVILKEKSKNMI